MNLKNLFEHRLLIVSGKGGVGKTTVSAALGRLAAGEGLKTLVVEVNGSGRLGPLFGEPEVGHEEVRVDSHLFLANIDANSAFHEYILEQIHSQTLYRLVFENRFVRSFLDATPGLKELLQIGKIWALCERRSPKSERPDYDLVIVDAPATGHGLALLEVPKVVTRAVRLGPLKTKAQNIVNLLLDPQKTLLLIVTLAEEMPVNESLEMCKKAKEDLQIGVGPIIVNDLFPTLLSEKSWKKLAGAIEKEDSLPEEVRKAIHLYQTRLLLEEEQCRHLENQVPVKKLPHLFLKEWGPEAISKLAEYLKTGQENL